MANLAESATYEAGIYQLETTDPVLGGPSGVANLQGKQLANRTRFLKEKLDSLLNGTGDKIALAKVEGLGTAADKNVGLLVGNVLGVGGGGIAGAGATVTNCDNTSQWKYGFNYMAAGATNRPSRVPAGQDGVLIVNGNGTSLHTQVLIVGSKIFQRSFVVDVWTAWTMLSGSDDIGLVAAFAMEAAPAGWLKCNGAAVSRTVYADLFATIGTVYGAGNGSTTFNVPDLRGEFVRGWNDNRGGVVDPGRVLGSFQADALAAHEHDLRDFAAGGGGDTGFDFAPPGSGGNFVGVGVMNQVGSFGGSETRPRNVALLYCIKY